MLFHSFEFIFIFLPITLFLYFYLNSKSLITASKFLLVVSSLIFYSWWNIVYLPLILLSMFFNFFISKTFMNNSIKFNKKILLLFGIFCNLALLVYFKYSDFFILNMNYTFNLGIKLLNLSLPLAISFFTFQQIAYLVDIYKDKGPEYNFLNYAVFVTFFPQLIAGPIVHHKEMMPQFEKLKNKIVNRRNISLGLFIFSIGLFKKVVIADTFSVWAIVGFDTTQTLNFFEAWATSLSYTFQLYFDFSGYMDMAFGLALFFNIKLPINFNSPYKALNIQDFWRRWHITLSRFLRDYIYIPLGGNQNGNLQTYANLMITFLIGGIWHGAGWTFIFWGWLHGLSIILYKLWTKLGVKLWGWLAWLITFNFINISWVFFRAKEWDDAIRVLEGMVSFDTIVLHEKLKTKLMFLDQYGVKFGEMFAIQGTIFVGVWIFISLIVIFTKNSSQLMLGFKQNNFYAFITALLFDMNKISDFLYFNF